jgi:hypothetical protein
MHYGSNELLVALEHKESDWVIVPAHTPDFLGGNFGFPALGGGVADVSGFTQIGERGFPPLVRYRLRNAFPSFSGVDRTGVQVVDLHREDILLPHLCPGELPHPGYPLEH